MNNRLTLIFISQPIRSSEWKGASIWGKNVPPFQNEFSLFYSSVSSSHEYSARPKSVNFRIRFDLINVCLQEDDC